MRVAYIDSDDRAGLRGYVQFNKYTYIHVHTYIHTYIHAYIHTYVSPVGRINASGIE